MSAALRSLDIKVLRSGAGTGDSLHARFLAMQLRQSRFAGGFVSQPSLVQIGGA